eukprot:7847819-Pyramimonas_sp.AAC.1
MPSTLLLASRAPKVLTYAHTHRPPHLFQSARHSLAHLSAEAGRLLIRLRSISMAREGVAQLQSLHAGERRGLGEVAAAVEELGLANRSSTAWGGSGTASLSLRLREDLKKLCYSLPYHACNTTQRPNVPSDDDPRFPSKSPLRTPPADPPCRAPVTLVMTTRSAPLKAVTKSS